MSVSYVYRVSNIYSGIDRYQRIPDIGPALGWPRYSALSRRFVCLSNHLFPHPSSLFRYILSLGAWCFVFSPLQQNISFHFSSMAVSTTPVHLGFELVSLFLTVGNPHVCVIVCLLLSSLVVCCALCGFFRCFLAPTFILLR